MRKNPIPRCCKVKFEIPGTKFLSFISIPPPPSICFYSPLFAAVHHCSPLFATVRRCSPLFATVRRCSPLFAAVPHCSPLFATVRRCSPLFAAVRHYSHCSYSSLFAIRDYSLLATIRYSLFGFSRHPRSVPRRRRYDHKYYICDFS